jgi:hypothetical protein
MNSGLFYQSHTHSTPQTFSTIETAPADSVVIVFHPDIFPTNSVSC